jgi:hypothetical protein
MTVYTDYVLFGFGSKLVYPARLLVSEKIADRSDFLNLPGTSVEAVRETALAA